MADRERVDYAVLVALMMREEAEVMAAALRADGIDAFIGNSNHAYAEWLLIPAMNGLQILVPRKNLADAKALVRQRIAENAGADPEEFARRRDGWRSRIGILLVLSPWLLGVVLSSAGGLGEWLYAISLGQP